MLDDRVPDAAHPSSLSSPCLGICLMDPTTRMCRGCLRTISEIAGWHDASAAEKSAILKRLAVRRAAIAEKR